MPACSCLPVLLLVTSSAYLCSVWDIVAAKHASVFQDSEHAVIVAYVSDKDPWSSSMRNSTLGCELSIVLVHMQIF